ncbi:hypothetical protein [Agromyces atrinae]|uniref:Uncharacterized protein n=1 Tax=Agromyces atrinae TaxID=592376 RepID=A0A4Q2M1J3_9MICO|nr:hypothetical protein [Agromyces atrinae]NYD65616.1 hypothetical protein [Agromyces atrinae]RXZ84997.1 hypothetical protein ESP50_17315 [Agromyces atrinae]
MKRTPRTSRWIAAALSLAVAVSLSACVTEPEPPPRTSSATPAPDSVFDSDADALAAAIEAYEAYNAASNVIFNEGGKDPKRVLRLVSEQYGEQLLKEFESFRLQGFRGSGATTFDSARLLDRYTDPILMEVVEIYLCADVGDSRVLDSEGRDQTPKDRPTRVPLVVNFQSDTAGSNRLIVGGSERWDGADSC